MPFLSQDCAVRSKGNSQTLASQDNLVSQVTLSLGSGVSRAKLDKYLLCLYNLVPAELHYILASNVGYGEDFPGETFHVLKENEIKQFGDAWRRSGKAPGRDAHGPRAENMR